MKSLIIRNAIEADMPAIMDLLQKKAEFDGSPDAFHGTIDSLSRAWFSQPPVAFVLLAELEKQVIGLATYFQTFSTFTGGPGLWLDDLFIYENFRSLGAGHALMNELAKIAQDRGCDRIEWTVALRNDRGISFYENHFASVGQNSRFVRLNKEGIEHLANNDR